MDNWQADIIHKDGTKEEYTCSTKEQLNEALKHIDVFEADVWVRRGLMPWIEYCEAYHFGW